MAKFKNAALMLTAGETARQWAKNNPEKASDYVDKATSFIDQRTKGKYRKQLAGLSQTVKKNLAGDTIKGSAVRGETPDAPRTAQKPFPDLRA
ncbi:antitoxin [Janibacter limosus]|uniref:Antitoxin n=1 Tax=Janibacter limosus TaxID=53458 RepID=A0AC61U255_9MICO|nr:antitoxin [Janibacter limosus]UUZ44095.1 antitoxin [Janibacter limosus]